MALGLVLLEAAVLAGVALVLVVRAVTGTSADLALGLFLALVAGGVAAGLVAAARAVAAGRLRPRSLVITWQLLQAATGLAVVQATTAQTPGVVRVVAWAAVVAALVVTVVLVRLRPGDAGPAQGEASPPAP